MKKFPIALQLYSVRDDLEKDFEGTLKKVKEDVYKRQGYRKSASASDRFAG